ncbi:MAG TPA: hypothetical protein VKX17_01530 [Planctomycetota bacterium]|nr:hypothetical protein [Planctomycetota bacterium]
MDAEEMRAMLSEKPFKPMRLCLSDGEKVIIMHPELARVLRRSMIVNVVGRNPEIADDEIRIVLIHVVRVEYVSRKARSDVADPGLN